MRYVYFALIGLAAVGLILAVVSALFKFQIMGVQAEGFSRACTNLALLAIASSVALRQDSTIG